MEETEIRPATIYLHLKIVKKFKEYRVTVPGLPNVEAVSEYRTKAIDDAVALAIKAIEFQLAK